MARKKTKKTMQTPTLLSERKAISADGVVAQAELSGFLRRCLVWGLGLLCLLVSISFYIGTYDTAHIKLTLFQMGALGLLGIWVARLALDKRLIFTKKNILLYLPFLLYYGFSLLSYLWLPYKAEAFEEFLRYVLYFLITLLVLSEFRLNAVKILTRFILIAAWVSFIYGFIQIIDGFIAGVDLMPWRAFFGKRIFSTHANPNFFADFVVFANLIVLAQWFFTRKKSLLVLFALGLLDLFFTESKGAWIGFAVSLAFFAALYTNFFPTGLRKHIKKINIAAAVLVLLTALLAGVYAGKRFSSVSFRAHTWLSTTQMIADSPIVGTGVGSYRIIYPAYRKPQIFYLENIHNSETQHAENEYLEQWATVGTLGFAFFLWLLFFILFTGIRNLGVLNRLTLENGKQKLSARSYLLLGYLAAFFGILVHNFFDISMRFVSTGLFFAVFGAVIICLSRGDEALRPEAEACVADGSVKTARPNRYGAVLWAGRFVLLGLMIWFICYLVGAFGETIGDLNASQTTGSWIIKILAWTVFFGVLLSGAFVYLRAAFISPVLRVILVLMLALYPVSYFIRFFQADFYYGVAAEFTKRRQVDGALDYYHKAITANPFNSMYYQYRGSLLKTQMDMSKVFAPKKGDKELPMNDYERVVRDFSKVVEMAPNHAMIHQEWGEFYYAAAVWYTQRAMETRDPNSLQQYNAQAVYNMEKAKESLKHSLLLDPVNERTYAYLISIALMERNATDARQYIERYRKGPEGVTEEEFLARHKNNPRIAQLEYQLWALEKEPSSVGR